MKDFDAERRDERAAKDRTFKFGGETFTAIAAVDMDVMARYEDDVLEGQGSKAYAETLETTILEFLVPEDRDRWVAMRTRVAQENGVTFGDASAVLQWLIARDANRPTGPSSPSSPGDGSGDPSSTADSVSPVTAETPSEPPKAAWG